MADLPPVDEIIRVEPFGWDVGVLRDLGEFVQWIADAGGADDTDWADADAACRGFRQPDGSNVFVAYIPEGAPPETLAHEAVHLSWYMMDTAGIAVDGDNHEVQAYLVGFFVRELTRLSEAPAEDEIAQDLTEMLSEDCRRYRKAGNDLAEASVRVVRDYDGLHRLSLAVSAWMQTVANEGRRDQLHASPDA